MINNTITSVKINFLDTHVEIIGFPDYPVRSYPRLDLSYEVAAGLTIGGIVNSLTGERSVETIPDYMRIMGAK